MHNRSVGHWDRFLTLHDPDAALGPDMGPETVGPETPDQGTRRSDVESTLRSLLDEPVGLELTSSCTHALEAAATVLGIGAGDEVIVPAFSFPSAANPFVMRGARLRFADCDPVTANVTAEEIERCASPRTRAVVCMHYGGVAADLDRIVALCGDAGWVLIEDAAHGLFGSWAGTPLGRFGAFGAFSFHRTKNISCHDGGALVLNDPALGEAVSVALDKGTNRMAFQRGDVGSYEWSGPGSAWRLAEPLVDILAEQLRLRDQIQSTRHRIWDAYRNALVDWAERVGARLPHVPPEAGHPAHLFWVLLPDRVRRQDFVEHCAAARIEVARHFGSLPASSFGSRLADPADECPEAARFASQLVRLPLHPGLTDDDAGHVIDAVTAFNPHPAPRRTLR